MLHSAVDKHSTGDLPGMNCVHLLEKEQFMPNGLQGLDEPLYEGERVRRPVRRLLHPQLGVLRRLIEVRVELVVAVVHDDVGSSSSGIV